MHTETQAQSRARKKRVNRTLQMADGTGTMRANACTITGHKARTRTRLDLPRPVPDIEQIQPVSNLVRRERVDEVLFVRQHQKGHAGHFVLLEERQELLSGLL